MQNEKAEPTETIKWKTIKEFVNQLDEEQLDRMAYVLIEDASHGTGIKDAFLTEQDIYVNIEDNEDSGSMDELKEWHGDDFDESQYKIVTTKGTPFLWAE